MNTQSEDMMEINFRDRLYDLDMEPSDAINNRIMDSIIDHTQTQGSKRSVAANIVRWVSGAALGVAVTVAFFMYRSSDLAPGAGPASGSRHIASAGRIDAENGLSAVPRTDDRLIPGNQYDGTFSNIVSNGIRKTNGITAHSQEAASAHTALRASVSVPSSRITDVHKDGQARRKNNFAPAEPTDIDVIGSETTQAVAKHSDTPSGNMPQSSEHHLLGADRYSADTHNPAERYLAQDPPLQLIACTSVGDDMAEAEMMLNKDLTLPHQLVHDAAMAAKDNFRGHGIELSAGYESYTNTADESANSKVTIRRANLLYTSQWGVYELKTGVAVSLAEAAAGCTYSSLRTDTVRSWLEVDSVDASGELVGKMHYETAQTTVEAQTAASVQSCWLSVPVLIGARTGYGRFSGALYGGAVFMQSVSQKYHADLSEGQTLVEYISIGNNSHTALAVCGQVQLGCRIAGSAELFVNGEYRRYLYGSATPRNSASDSPSLGANVGLRYSF